MGRGAVPALGLGSIAARTEGLGIGIIPGVDDGVGALFGLLSLELGFVLAHDAGDGEFVSVNREYVGLFPGQFHGLVVIGLGQAHFGVLPRGDGGGDAYLPGGGGDKPGFFGTGKSRESPCCHEEKVDVFHSIKG